MPQFLKNILVSHQLSCYNFTLYLLYFYDRFITYVLLYSSMILLHSLSVNSFELLYSISEISLNIGTLYSSSFGGKANNVSLTENLMLPAMAGRNSVVIKASTFVFILFFLCGHNGPPSQSLKVLSTLSLKSPLKMNQ